MFLSQLHQILTTFKILSLANSVENLQKPNSNDPTTPERCCYTTLCNINIRTWKDYDIGMLSG